MATFSERKALKLREQEIRLQQRELRLRQWQVEYESKGESERAGFRGLIVINGGAAVAFGALLQAVVGGSANQDFVPWILWAIGASGAGVVPAAVAFIIAYMQWTLEVDAGRYRFRNPWWWAKWIAGLVSALLFVASVALVVVGGFRALVP